MRQTYLQSLPPYQHNQYQSKTFRHCIIVINQFCTSFRVVNRGWCYVITCYQFGLTTYLCVVLIVVEYIYALLCPESIQYLCDTSCVDCRSINYLHLLFCLPGFPLLYFLVRRHNKTHIFSFVDNQTKSLSVCIKLFKQLIICSASCLFFSVLPYRTSIRNIIFLCLLLSHVSNITFEWVSLRKNM